MNMNIKQKIGAVVATVTMLSSIVTPAFASEYEISGNGVESTNKIKVESNCTQTVTQVNETTIKNKVYSSASTGGNEASANTGGDVTVDTGNATSDVTVTNEGSSNEATVDPCCCPQQEGDSTNSALIAGNGVGSYNKIKKNSSKSSVTTQVNETRLRNKVKSKAKTGKNKANVNTGPGDVEVKTGDAESLVSIENTTPSNTLNP